MQFEIFALYLLPFSLTRKANTGRKLKDALPALSLLSLPLNLCPLFLDLYSIYYLMNFIISENKQQIKEEDLL